MRDAATATATAPFTPAEHSFYGIPSRLSEYGGASSFPPCILQTVGQYHGPDCIDVAVDLGIRVAALL